ncbi:MAG: ankyrin repeat domain-containing protein [bacterium]|nr:ankyrin repeat domain-containing protein [bacterium]
MLRATHTSFAARQRANPNYKLFAAAFDGCLECCRQLIEDRRVDAFCQSDTYQYNALEYAVRARQSRNTNTHALEVYLTELGLTEHPEGPNRRPHGK